jgi:cytochrome c553
MSAKEGKTGVLAILQSLGLPTENENGHALGCVCDQCHAARATRFEELRARRLAGEKPETLLEMISLEATKRRSH